MNAFAEFGRVRAERDALKSQFDAQLAIVKADVSARSVAGRVKDSAVDTAQDMLAEAYAIADENRPVVAGTIAALAIWFLRDPLLAAAQHGFDAIRDVIED